MDKTNAMRILDRKKVEYKIYTHNLSAEHSGAEVAKALGQAPEQVFKTLVTRGRSGKNYVFMIPVEEELDLKKAAKAAGEKSVEMVKSKELLPLTGYVHGGCSPVGMKKQFPTFIHSSAEELERVIFSGGRVGVQVELELSALRNAVPVKSADIIVSAED